MKNLFAPKRITLNSRGFAHFVGLLAVVMLVGVVGTYFLVKSHADPITITHGVPPPPPQGPYIQEFYSYQSLAQESRPIQLSWNVTASSGCRLLDYVSNAGQPEISIPVPTSAKNYSFTTIGTAPRTLGAHSIVLNCAPTPQAHQYGIHNTASQVFVNITKNPIICDPIATDPTSCYAKSIQAKPKSGIAGYTFYKSSCGTVPATPTNTCTVKDVPLAATVVVKNTAGTPVSFVTAKSNGTFTLDIAPGSYTLVPNDVGAIKARPVNVTVNLTEYTPSLIQFVAPPAP